MVCLLVNPARVQADDDDVVVVVVAAAKPSSAGTESIDRRGFDDRLL
jgi:hypothetical protein